MEEPSRDIPIAGHQVSPADLVRIGEDPRAARERIIDQIIEMYPELGEDPSLLASLRGEPGSYIILSVPPKYREAAPLIARVYHLLEREYREHPERFRLKRR